MRYLVRALSRSAFPPLPIPWISLSSTSSSAVSRFFLNSVAISYGSTAALPFSSVLALFSLITLLALPLTLVSRSLRPFLSLPPIPLLFYICSV